MFQHWARTQHRAPDKRFRPLITAIASALALLLAACGTSGSELGLGSYEDLDVSYTVKMEEQEFQPGERYAVDITIKLEGDFDRPCNAVAFLNVVEEFVENGEKRTKQVAHKLFDHATPHPMIFRTPMPCSRYAGDGVSTTLRFRVSNNADTGQYYLALQLYPGTNTNPHNVNAADRIGGVGVTPFTITND